MLKIFNMKNFICFMLIIMPLNQANSVTPKSSKGFIIKFEENSDIISEQNMIIIENIKKASQNHYIKVNLFILGDGFEQYYVNISNKRIKKTYEIFNNSGFKQDCVLRPFRTEILKPGFGDPYYNNRFIVVSVSEERCEINS